MLVDDNGNLKDDGSRLLVWDAFNRLVAVARKSDGAPIAVYGYLPDGRRSRKVVYSQTSPGVVEREVRFAWDGAQEVEEQNAAGVTLATFVWSPVYVDELVEFRREAAHPLGAGSFYAHQDARCDVVAVTNASGVVVENRRYDDFGREEIRDASEAVVAASPSGLEYGFQGRRRDAETGWLYFRARFYDPETGRFLSRDPVWDAGNVGGWYTFVGNGPVSGVDPSGRLGGLLEHLEKAYEEAKKGNVGAALWNLAKAEGEAVSVVTGINPLDPLAGIRQAEAAVQSFKAEQKRLESISGTVSETIGPVQGFATATGVGAADAIGISDAYEAVTGTDLGHFSETGNAQTLTKGQRTKKGFSALVKVATAASMVRKGQPCPPPKAAPVPPRKEGLPNPSRWPDGTPKDLSKFRMKTSEQQLAKQVQDSRAYEVIRPEHGAKAGDLGFVPVEGGPVKFAELHTPTGGRATKPPGQITAEGMNSVLESIDQPGRMPGVSKRGAEKIGTTSLKGILKALGLD